MCDTGSRLSPQFLFDKSGDAQKDSPEQCVGQENMLRVSRKKGKQRDKRAQAPTISSYKVFLTYVNTRPDGVSLVALIRTS